MLEMKAEQEQEFQRRMEEDRILQKEVFKTFFVFII
jgi:hypothetical protein